MPWYIANKDYCYKTSKSLKWWYNMGVVYNVKKKCSYKNKTEDLYFFILCFLVSHVIDVILLPRTWRHFPREWWLFWVQKSGKIKELNIRKSHQNFTFLFYVLFNVIIIKIKVFLPIEAGLSIFFQVYQYFTIYRWYFLFLNIL